MMATLLSLSGGLRPATSTLRAIAPSRRGTGRPAKAAAVRGDAGPGQVDRFDAEHQHRWCLH